MNISEPRVSVYHLAEIQVMKELALRTRRTINIYSEFSKVGITPFKVAHHYNRIPPMTHILQILMIFVFALIIHEGEFHIPNAKSTRSTVL